MRLIYHSYILVFFLLLNLFAVRNSSNNATDKSRLFKANAHTSYQIIQQFERKPEELFFTQGLSFISDNALLESSGLYRHSDVHYLDLNTMAVRNQYRLQDNYFGEGSSMVQIGEEKIVFVMTWMNRIVLKMNEQLSLLAQIQMPREIAEGWGMTSYTKEGQDFLIISDGSHKIYHVDPRSFTVVKEVEVKDAKGKIIKRINELEMYQDNLLLANIFMTNYLILVDPFTGQLVEHYDMTELVDLLNSRPGYLKYTQVYENYCLNGIAYNSNTSQLLITGKKWPTIYEIKFYKY